jgi:multidrug efflux system membrane fusion protein
MQKANATPKKPASEARFRWKTPLFVALLALAGGIYLTRTPAPPPHAAKKIPAPVPVTAAAATARDVPIYLSALGTVQASDMVALRSQIDGVLKSVNFKEGQEVHKGDVLAEIDSHALAAVVAQGVAKKAEDQAQLVAAEKDLDRFKELAKKSYSSQQSIDQQQAKVDQLKATIDGDQATIDNSRTQLSYATIRSPIEGRAGFRQIDAGNVIHANDPNPLTVITKLRPALTILTLPQKDLGAVREAMRRGPVPVAAFDQDNERQLAEGKLMLIDNQIDQATSTIRLKASFPNEDERLWPGEFVHIRVHADTRKGAVTIPAAALQRGPDGFYVWVVTPDNKADHRPLKAVPVSDKLVIVTHGLKAGEQVVVSGQYRLQTGTPVEAKTGQGANAKKAGS